MLDNESLKMIAQIMDEKLAANNRILRNELRKDLRKELREDFQADIHTALLPIKQDLAEVKADIKHIKVDVSHINIELENEIQPNIKLLADCYSPAAKRYEHDHAELGMVKSDIATLQTAVAGHSVILNRLTS